MVSSDMLICQLIPTPNFFSPCPSCSVLYLMALKYFLSGNDQTAGSPEDEEDGVLALHQDASSAKNNPIGLQQISRNHC